MNRVTTIKFKHKTCSYDDQTGVTEVTHELSNPSPHLPSSHPQHPHPPQPIKKNYLYCLNCNKKGHRHKDCRFPINSYGLVVYKGAAHATPVTPVAHDWRYLMIQKRYTPVYVELLRARYHNGSMLNLKYLTAIIMALPLNERHYITSYEFDYLWHSLWRWQGTTEQMQCIFEDMSHASTASICFKQSSESELCFASLFRDHPTTLLEPDWEFPKGRREDGESDQDCAIRECAEETTLKSDDYKIFLDVKLFQEKFNGINHITYCNSYYLAELTNHDQPIYYDPAHFEQNREIRKIGWFTEAEVKQLINPEHKYRFSMFADIHQLVTNFKNKV